MSPPKTRGPGFASDETRGQKQIIKRPRHYHLPIDVQVFIAALAPWCLAVLLLLRAWARQ
jgi:hypothetical protein